MGGRVYLRDVASIRDQFKDTPGKRYLGEEETIVLTVFAKTNENILDNAAAAREYITGFNETHAGVNLTVVEDGSEGVEENISTMTSNGIAGFVLVLIVLAFVPGQVSRLLGCLKDPGGHHRYVPAIRDLGDYD